MVEGQITYCVICGEEIQYNLNLFNGEPVCDNCKDEE